MSDISHSLVPLPEGHHDLVSQSHDVTQSNLSALEKVINAPTSASDWRVNPLPATLDIAPPACIAQLTQDIATVSNLTGELSASAGSFEATTPSVKERKYSPSAASNLSPSPFQPAIEFLTPAASQKMPDATRSRRGRKQRASATATAEQAERATARPAELIALTDIVRKKINQTTSPDFALLLSCITKNPVIFLTQSDKPANKPTYVYQHGESITGNISIAGFSDAIIFTKRKHDITLTIKRSGMESTPLSLPVKDYVELLSTIPQELYRYKDIRQVYAFMSAPINIFRKQGEALYHELKDAVQKDDIELIRERYREVSIFECSLTGGLAKESFYQQLFNDIKNHAAGTGRMIAFISRHFYCPPAEELKLMTEGVIYKRASQPADTHNLSTYLCALAEKLPRERISELHTAIQTVVISLQNEIKSYVELMEKCKKIFLNMLNTEELEKKKTRENFRFYYDEFLSAIKNTGMPDTWYDIAIEQLFLLRGYADANFSEKLLPVVKEALGRNLNIIRQINQHEFHNICTLEDRVFSMLIVNAYLLPAHTAPYLAEHFIKLLSKHGSAGVTPMASCHLTDYIHTFLPPEFGKKFFYEKFYQYIKGENRANGLTMLLACNLFLQESEIYNYSPSELVKVFRVAWHMYHNVCHQNINENQCVVFQNGSAYIDDKEKWGNKIDTMEKELTVMSKASAEKWFSKCEYIETEVFRHPDAMPLLNVILQSLPSHPQRKNIIENLIATHLTGEKWAQNDKIEALNKHLKTIVRKVPRADKADKNDKTDKSGKTHYTSSVLGVIDIQLTLLAHYLQSPSREPDDNTLLLSKKIIGSMASNIQLIDKAIETRRVIDLFRTRLNQPATVKSPPAGAEMSLDLYLTIINSILIKSLSRNVNDGGKIFRTQILKSVFDEMDKRLQLDKLFHSLSKIITMRSFAETGYNFFQETVINEITTAAPSAEKRRMTESERKALAAFIIAQPVNFTLLTNACIACSGEALNTQWVINAEHFFDAAPPVKYHILNFIQKILQEEPVDFIMNCLNEIDAQLALPSSDKMEGMAKSINSICNYLQHEPPAEVQPVVTMLAGLYLKLQQHDTIKAILTSVQNSLKAMTTTLIRQQRLSHETLPEALQALAMTSQSVDYYQTVFKDDGQTRSASGSEYRLSKDDSVNTTDDTTSGSEMISVRQKIPKAKKTITPRTLFCAKSWEKLHADENVIAKLKEQIYYFITDPTLRSLNLHAYYDGDQKTQFYTFDVKNIKGSAKLGGRSDYRAMVEFCDNNRFRLLGIGTHAETIAVFNRWVSDKIPGMARTIPDTDKILHIDEDTRSVEWRTQPQPE